MTINKGFVLSGAERALRWRLAHPEKCSELAKQYRQKIQLNARR